MISLANHSQTEQGWFYVNFDGHLASFYIHENPQKFKFISSIPNCSVSFKQIVNNYAYLRKESAPGTSGYLVSLLWSCTKLSQYVQLYKFEL